MNNNEINKIIRLVIKSLQEKNLISFSSKVSPDPGGPGESNNYINNSSEIRPDIDQVLSAEVVRDCAKKNVDKIIVPETAIVTDLAVEEANKLDVEIKEE